MKIVSPTSEQTTMKIIPRESSLYVAVIIRDEETKKVVSQDVYLTEIEDNYLQMVFDYPFAENQAYTMEVFKIEASEYYEQYESRVEGDNGDFVTSDCLYQFYLDLYDNVQNLIYRNNLFCTSQKLDKYSINNERFVEAPSSATTFKF